MVATRQAPRTTPRIKTRPLFPGIGAVHRNLQQRQRFVFVTNPTSLDPVEVDALWRLACDSEGSPHSIDCLSKRTPQRWETVLRHSFAIQAVFEVPAPQPGASRNSRKGRLPDGPNRLVGFARVMSDGVFAALISDVCIHPDCQRQGLGKKLVAQLLRHTKHQGPASFAVFPRPSERMFWWGNGFRVTSKYRVMLYRGPRTEPPVHVSRRHVTKRQHHPS